MQGKFEDDGDAMVQYKVTGEGEDDKIQRKRFESNDSPEPPLLRQIDRSNVMSFGSVQQPQFNGEDRVK